MKTLHGQMGNLHLSQGATYVDCFRSMAERRRDMTVVGSSRLVTGSEGNGVGDEGRKGGLRMMGDRNEMG